MWLSLIPVFAIAVAIAYLPGFVVLLPTRLKLLGKLSGAPVVSIAIFAISATVANLVGLKWGLGSVLLWTFALTVLTAILSSFGGRLRLVNGLADARPELLRISQYLLGMIVAGIIIGGGLLPSFHDPDTIAQRFDNAFHLNAIAGILYDGTASPLTLTQNMGGGFYPAGWHEFVALTILVSGAALNHAVHLCTFAVVYVVWPLACAALLETVFRPYAAVRILLGTICLSMIAFPYVVLNWGLIYPNILGFALVPALTALIVQMCALARICLPINLETGWILVLFMVGAGISHPNAVFLALAFTAPAIVLGVVRRLKVTEAGSVRRSRVEAALLTLVLIALAIGWKILQPGLGEAMWERYETYSQALGEFISGTSIGIPGIKAVSVLAFVGLVFLCTDRVRRWLLAGILVIAALFVVGAGWPSGVFRDLVVGVFYRDTRRTGMVAALAGVLLCTYAVQRILVASHTALRRRWAGTRIIQKLGVTRLFAGIVVAVLIPLNLLVVMSEGFRWAAVGVSESFGGEAQANILSGDESALMIDIEEFVPADATIINNSWDGSGLIYAYTGREVMDFYMFEVSDPDEDLLRERLRYASSDPAVCDVISERNAWYFVEFDDWAISANAPALDQPGFSDIAEAPGFTLLAQRGDSSLYRIDACR